MWITVYSDFDCWAIGYMAVVPTEKIVNGMTLREVGTMTVFKAQFIAYTGAVAFEMVSILNGGNVVPVARKYNSQSSWFRYHFNKDLIAFASDKF